MSSGEPSIRRCVAFNAEGKPCSANPEASSPYCFWHNPTKKEEQLLARTKGGLMSRPRPLSPNAPNPTMRSPKDVINLLEETSGAVLRGELSPQLANSAAYAATVALKAMEIEISDRLDRLDKRLREQQQAKTV